jgi:hypothetical protein
VVVGCWVGILWLLVVVGWWVGILWLVVGGYKEQRTNNKEPTTKNQQQ